MVGCLGVCTGRTSGVVFCPSLFKAHMDFKIRSSAPVDAGGVVICCWDLLKFMAVRFSLEILLHHHLAELLSSLGYQFNWYGGCSMVGLDQGPDWGQELMSLCKFLPTT